MTRRDDLDTLLRDHDTFAAVAGSDDLSHLGAALVFADMERRD